MNRYLLLAVLGMYATFAGFAQIPEARVTIDVTAEKAGIAPTMYGVFFRRHQPSGLWGILCRVDSQPQFRGENITFFVLNSDRPLSR